MTRDIWFTTRGLNIISGEVSMQRRNDFIGFHSSLLDISAETKFTAFDGNRWDGIGILFTTHNNLFGGYQSYFRGTVEHIERFTVYDSEINFIDVNINNIGFLDIFNNSHVKALNLIYCSNRNPIFVSNHSSIDFDNAIISNTIYGGGISILNTPDMSLIRNSEILNTNGDAIFLLNSNVRLENVLAEDNAGRGFHNLGGPSSHILNNSRFVNSTLSEMTFTNIPLFYIWGQPTHFSSIIKDCIEHAPSEVFMFEFLTQNSPLNIIEPDHYPCGCPKSGYIAVHHIQNLFVSPGLSAQHMFYPCHHIFSFGGLQTPGIGLPIDFGDFNDIISLIIDGDYETAMASIKVFVDNHPNSGHINNLLSFLPMLYHIVYGCYDDLFAYLETLELNGLCALILNLQSLIRIFEQDFICALDLLYELLDITECPVEILIADLNILYCYFRLNQLDCDEDGLRISNYGPATMQEFMQQKREKLGRFNPPTITEIAECNECAPPVHPAYFSLGHNFPNPFNPKTTINFTVGSGLASTQVSTIASYAGHAPLEQPHSSVHVTLEIFNIRGQRVRTLVSGIKEPGHHSIVWDSTDGRGQSVSSGIYFYRLTAGDFVETRRMLLLK
jgi:hypothetical protein